MKTGIELIAEERLRQIEQERWSLEHDDDYRHAELSRAAFCYVDHAILKMRYQGRVDGPIPLAVWPWDSCYWKPSADPVRDLVRAGALIAAEIDRLQRTQTEME